MSPDLIADIQLKLFMSLICVLNIVPCWLLRREMQGLRVRMLNQATLAFGIGMPMMLFKNDLPHVPAVIVGNALVLGAMGLLWRVAAALAGRAPDRRPVWIAPILWALCWLVPAFSHHLDTRIAVAAVMSGALIALALIEILRDGARDLPRGLLVATGLIHIAISAARVVLALRHSAFATSALWVTATQLNTLAYMMLWPTLCTVLVNRQSLAAEADRGRRDELSGVLNRRGVLDDIRVSERGTLLLFDIDRFKQINDRFGHAGGDGIIVAFTRLAAQVLGPSVIFGRIGGEEFLAMVAVRDRRTAVDLAEQVRTGFAAMELPGGMRATVSVGVAAPADGETVEAQLVRADRALYRAKDLGRNRIETSAQGETWSAEADLLDALAVDAPGWR